MVTRTLHVVVTAHRISSSTRPHVVPRDEKQVGNGGRGVRALVVLRDSHGPCDTNPFRLRDHVRYGGQSFDR